MALIYSVVWRYKAPPFSPVYILHWTGLNFISPLPFLEGQHLATSFSSYFLRKC